MAIGSSAAGFLGSWDVDDWELFEIDLAKHTSTPLTAALHVLDNCRNKYQREYRKKQAVKTYTLFGVKL